MPSLWYALGLYLRRSLLVSHEGWSWFLLTTAEYKTNTVAISNQLHFVIVVLFGILFTLDRCLSIFEISRFKNKKGAQRKVWTKKISMRSNSWLQNSVKKSWPQKAQSRTQLQRWRPSNAALLRLKQYKKARMIPRTRSKCLPLLLWALKLRWNFLCLRS